MRSKQKTVIELFSGAGIFGSAFQAERFKLVTAIEKDHSAVATYRSNLGDHILEGDIRSFKPTGTTDVLIAGPPCQGYSSLGKRDELDPRNKLSLQILRWAKATSPKVVVIENVPQFLVSEQANKIRRALRRCGYELFEFVLNTVQFGVPQNRRRAIIIASQIGTPKIVRPKTKIRNVREAWQGLSKKPDGRNGHDFREPSELALSRIKNIPYGGDKRNLLLTHPDICPPSWHSTSTEVTDVWGRMLWDKPSNTLRTCFLNPSKGRYIHPTENRVITIREGARLHTIPDSYEFVGTPYQVARQIGNSVPYNFGKCIARAVKRCFN